jgi:hypothetical protein
MKDMLKQFCPVKVRARLRRHYIQTKNNHMDAILGRRRVKS